MNMFICRTGIGCSGSLVSFKTASQSIKIIKTSLTYRTARPNITGDKYPEEETLETEFIQTADPPAQQVEAQQEFAGSCSTDVDHAGTFPPATDPPVNTAKQFRSTITPEYFYGFLQGY